MQPGARGLYENNFPEWLGRRPARAGNYSFRNAEAAALGGRATYGS